MRELAVEMLRATAALGLAATVAYGARCAGSFGPSRPATGLERAFDSSSGTDHGCGKDR